MSSDTRESSVDHRSPRLRQFQIRQNVATLTAVPCSKYAVGISIDGGTTATVSTAANGHQTIDVALTVAGVSNNTHSSFNVDVAGASPNHVGINTWENYQSGHKSQFQHY